MSEVTATSAPAPTQADVKEVTTETVAAKPEDMAAASVTSEVKATESKDSSAESSAQSETKDKPDQPERVVPEKYDLKLSEGSPLDAAALSKLESIAKDQKLTQEEAQSLLVRQESEVRAFLDTQRTSWYEQAVKDAEIGGDKLKENVELAKRAFEKVAPVGLKEEMDRTGYGNHPLVIKMFAKIGRMMGEDKLVQAGGPVTTPKSAAELLYGGTKST